MEPVAYSILNPARLLGAAGWQPPTSSAKPTSEVSRVVGIGVHVDVVRVLVIRPPLGCNG